MKPRRLRMETGERFWRLAHSRRSAGVILAGGRLPRRSNCAIQIEYVCAVVGLRLFRLEFSQFAAQVLNDRDASPFPARSFAARFALASALEFAALPAILRPSITTTLRHFPLGSRS